jgi:phage terminase small subunit
MRALTEKQRAFVDYLVSTGTDNECEAARAAGYNPDAPEGSSAIRVSAHRLAHDQRIIDAIGEETSRRVSFMLPMAYRAMLELVKSPNHKDHFKAVEKFWIQGGLDHKGTVKHEHAVSAEQMIAEMRRWADEMGIPQEKVIGSQTIDHEEV